MKIIGITGGVGAGKTQILEYLNNKYGATICMADEVGKKLQKKGTECFDEIVAHFGEKILDEKGELDRTKLSDIVFADTEWDCTSKSKRRNSEEDCKRRTQKYESDAD